MQTSLTLTIDEEILKTVRQIAEQRNTSLDALVRDYLAHLAKETQDRRAASSSLDESVHTK